METLKDRLQKKQFVVTAEIQPPIGTGVDEVLRNIERVRGRVDGLIVPEFQIEGMVSDSLGTCKVLKENRYDPILQTRPGREIGWKFSPICFPPRRLVSKTFSPSRRITASPGTASRS